MLSLHFFSVLFPRSITYCWSMMWPDLGIIWCWWTVHMICSLLAPVIYCASGCGFRIDKVIGQQSWKPALAIGESTMVISMSSNLWFWIWFLEYERNTSYSYLAAIKIDSTLQSCVVFLSNISRHMQVSVRVFITNQGCCRSIHAGPAHGKDQSVSLCYVLASPFSSATSTGITILFKLFELTNT
jgi:hypothetical protein